VGRDGIAASLRRAEDNAGDESGFDTGHGFVGAG
jgi:hypothetical protein